MLENKKLEEMNQLWASIDLNNINTVPVENDGNTNIAGFSSSLDK